MIRYLPIQPTTPDWRRDALCAQVDTAIFFPEQGEPTRDAKRVCGGCTVRSTCLQDALDRGEQFGVWGGLSAKERQRLRPADAGWRPDRITDAVAGVRRAAA